MNRVKKHFKQIISLGLTVVLAGGLLCCPGFAVEESEAAVDSALEQQLLQQAMDAGLDPAGQEEGENSWRYRDGELIEEAPVPLGPEAGTFGAGISAGNGADVSTFADGVTFGVDVSKFQGSIDWNAARNAGVQFAIIRCGYGLNLSSQDDPYWAANANGCRNAGIPFGVYIYSYATSVAHARSEAEHVLRLVQGYNLSYPIYLDLEENRIAALGNDQIAAIADTFCSIISNAGYSVGVYANKSWWNNYLTNPVFGNRGWSRWIAHWNTGVNYAGSTYNMWQYGGSYVNGIPGAVDSNYWYGEAAPVVSPSVPKLEHSKTLEEGVYRFKTADGTPLSAAGTGDVLWHVRYDVATKSYNLLDLSSGLALAYGCEGLFETAKVTGDYWQQFYIDSTSSGYRIYPHKYDTDFALRFSGGALGLAPRSDSAGDQLFAFTNVSEEIATVPDGAYRILCADDSGKALAVDNALLDSGVELRYTDASLDEPGQRFTVTGMDAGTYFLQSLSSNLYASVEGDEKEEGTRLVQWSYSGADGQKWFFLKTPNETYNIVSAQSGMYVGKSSAGSVGIFTPDASKAQEFSLEMLFAHTVADGIYTIAVADNSGLCLDVKDHTFEKGAEIQLAAPQENPTPENKWQKFRVTYMGSGLYTIANYASQYASDETNNYTQNVTAFNNDRVEGTGVVQYTSQNTPGQRWYFQEAGDGTYYIVSRCSGLYIGAPEVKNDVSLQVWGKNNQNIMKFTLVTTAEEDGTAGQNAIVGDVSGDGTLDVEDLLYCASIVCERLVPTARQILLADIDGDGVVTVKDLARLSAYLAGKTHVL